MIEKKDEFCDKITRDVFNLWEVAWRAGYETCIEDLELLKIKEQKDAGKE